MRDPPAAPGSSLSSPLRFHAPQECIAPQDRFGALVCQIRLAATLPPRMIFIRGDVRVMRLVEIYEFRVHGDPALRRTVNIQPAALGLTPPNSRDPIVVCDLQSTI
jgi:hypothetical protein